MVLKRKSSETSKSVEYIFLDPESYSVGKKAKEVFTHILGREPRIYLLAPYTEKVFYAVLPVDGEEVHVLGLYNSLTGQSSSLQEERIRLNSILFLNYLGLAEEVYKTKDLNEEVAPLPRYLTPKVFIRELYRFLLDAHSHQTGILGVKKDEEVRLYDHPPVLGTFLSKREDLFRSNDSSHFSIGATNKNKVWKEFLDKLNGLLKKEEVVNKVIGGIEKKTVSLQGIEIDLNPKLHGYYSKVETSISFYIPYREDVRGGKIFWLIHPLPIVSVDELSSEEKLTHILFHGVMVPLLEEPFSSLVEMSIRVKDWRVYNDCKNIENEDLPVPLHYSKKLCDRVKLSMTKGFTLRVLPKEDGGRKGALINVKDSLYTKTLREKKDFVASFPLGEEMGEVAYFVDAERVSPSEFHKELVRHIGASSSRDRGAYFTLPLSRYFKSFCVPVDTGKKENLYYWDNVLFEVLLSIKENRELIFERMVSEESNLGHAYLLDLAVENPGAFVEFIKRRKVTLSLENYIDYEATTVFRKVYLKNEGMLLSESEDIEVYISFH